MTQPQGDIHIIVCENCLLEFCTPQTCLQWCFVHSLVLNKVRWTSVVFILLTYRSRVSGHKTLFFLMYIIQHRSKWRNPSGRKRGNKMNSDLPSTLQTHPPQQVLDASLRRPGTRSPLCLQLGLAGGPLYLLTACSVVPAVTWCASWQLKHLRWVGSVTWVWTSSFSSSWMGMENMRWEIENSSRNYNMPYV